MNWHFCINLCLSPCRSVSLVVILPQHCSLDIWMRFCHVAPYNIVSALRVSNICRIDDFNDVIHPNYLSLFEDLYHSNCSIIYHVMRCRWNVMVPMAWHAQTKKPLTDAYIFLAISLRRGPLESFSRGCLQDGSICLYSRNLACHDRNARVRHARGKYSEKLHCQFIFWSESVFSVTFFSSLHSWQWSRLHHDLRVSLSRTLIVSRGRNNKGFMSLLSRNMAHVHRLVYKKQWYGHDCDDAFKIVVF